MKGVSSNIIHDLHDINHLSGVLIDLTNEKFNKKVLMSIRKISKEIKNITEAYND